jgi:uracil-DNA glycosylase family 4
MAEIAFVGEAPASDEIMSGRPFTGGAGRTLYTLTRKAGFDRDSCLIRNTVRCQVPNNDMGSYEHAAAAIEHCSETFLLPELSEMPSLKVVIPLGNSANWIITRRGSPGAGIYSYRGYPYTDPIHKFLVLPTIHPAALMRDRTMWNVVVADLKKAFRFASGGYERPKEEFQVPTLPLDVELAVETLIAAKVVVTVDIENPGGQLVLFGFGFMSYAMCVPFVNDDGTRYWKTDEDELRVIRAIYRLLAAPDVPKNVQYEQHERFWLTQYGFELGGEWYDTHAMHALAYPSLPHNLRFLGSVHSDRPEWKSLAPDWSEEMEEVDK